MVFGFGRSTHAGGLAGALAKLERPARQGAAGASVQAERLHGLGARGRGGHDARGDGEEDGGDSEELHFCGLKVKKARDTQVSTD